MSNKVTKYYSAMSATIIVTLLLVLSWVMVEQNFPAFQYGDKDIVRQLIPAEPYDDIAADAARFLWGHRALDLNSQAFVIVAAVICCLAMLKVEEGGHS